MSNLRLLIVDDETLIRKGIRNAASRTGGIDVIGECACGREAIDAIEVHRPDLVVLDIHMPDCSGLEVIRQVGVERMPPVIFITAYDEYAVQAFELNAVDYLLKPFDQDRFRESIERARRRIPERDQAALVNQLQKLLEWTPPQLNRPSWSERLVIRNGEHYDFVPVESVDWIESADNYVQLHCGSKQYLMDETLINMEGRLDPAKFRRIHRCRIVNISRVVAVHPLLSGSYEIELGNGIRLTTGRQYKGVIQQLLQG